MEKVANYNCPRCGELQRNIYFSDNADVKVGAWCERCNLKAYFHGEELVSIDSYS